MGRKEKKTKDCEELQPEVIYEQAKALASRDTIDSLTRAVELLSTISDRKKVNTLAENCLRRIMVLEARAREKRHKIIRMALVFAVSVSFSLYIILGIVRTSVNYRQGPVQDAKGNQEGGSLQVISSNGGTRREVSGGEESSQLPSDGDYDSLITTGNEEVSDEDVQSQSAAVHGEVPDGWVPPVSSGQNNTLTGTVTGEGGMHGGDGFNDSGSGNASEAGQMDSSGSAARTADATMTAKMKSGEDGLSGTEEDGPGSGESSQNQESLPMTSGAVEKQSGSDDISSLTDKETVSSKDATIHLDRSAYLTLLSIFLAAFVVLRLRKVIRAEIQYRKAVSMIQSGHYSGAINLFKSLEGYRDSAVKISGCQTAIKDEKYAAAVRMKDSGKLEDAIRAFNRLEGYKDSSDQMAGCRQSMKDRDYEEALALLKQNDYEGALKAFSAFDGYRDSQRMAEKCRRLIQMKPIYIQGATNEAEGKYEEALALYETIPGFQDVDARIHSIKQSVYDAARKRMDCGDHCGAAEVFDSLGDFENSSAMAAACRQTIRRQDYEKALTLKDAGRYEDAIDALRRLTDHPEAKAQIEVCRKLVKVPRPFDGLDHGLTTERVLAVYGPAAEQKKTADGKTELVYPDRRFMNCGGHVTVTLSADAVESVSWTADLSADGSGGGSVNADKLCSSIIKYYTGLFGKQASDRQSPGHKVVWWLSPAITVDYSKDRYIHIMY